MAFKKIGRFSYFNPERDVSQRNVLDASKGINGEIEGQPIKIEDQEVINLLYWLAEQQGISPELALKKAVVNAAYIRDITANQVGKLLVQRRDSSVAEIILK